jgi:DNA-directed RNA polymerase beta' subunit
MNLGFDRFLVFSSFTGSCFIFGFKRLDFESKTGANFVFNIEASLKSKIFIESSYFDGIVLNGFSFSLIGAGRIVTSEGDTENGYLPTKYVVVAILLKLDFVMNSVDAVL